VLKAAANP